LQTCLDNLAEIEAWRNTLSLSLRLQLNAGTGNPTTRPAVFGINEIALEVTMSTSILAAASVVALGIGGVGGGHVGVVRRQVGIAAL
jgi:hypothetical protein